MEQIASIQNTDFSKLWTPELDNLLELWKKKIQIKRNGHYAIANRWNRYHYYLGIPVTILTTLISTGTLATFQNCSDKDDNSNSPFGCKSN